MDVRAGRRAKKTQVYYDGKAWTSRAMFVDFYMGTWLGPRALPADGDRTDVRLDPEAARRLKQMLEAHDHKVYRPNPNTVLSNLRFVWCPQVNGGTWRVLANVNGGGAATMWIGRQSFERVFDKLKAEQRGTPFPWNTEKHEQSEMYKLARRITGKQHERYADDDVCVACQTTDPGKLQCDHFPVRFIDLWHQYVDQSPGGVSRLYRDKDKPGLAGWRDEWKEFHQRYATYQPLCRACHQHKSAEERDCEPTFYGPY